LRLVLTSLAGELSGSDPEAHLKITDGFDKWETLVTAGLTNRHQEGLLTQEADPQDLGLALMSAIQGGLLLAQARGYTKPVEVAFETMFQYIQSFRAS